MKVRDVMSTELVTVTRDVPLKQAAWLMLEAPHLGAAGRRRRPRPRRAVGDGRPVQGDEGARPARDRRLGAPLRRPAVTIPPARSVADAATMLLELRIDRLPVVDSGRLVGLVTRSDLVRAFARTDAAIVDEIRNDVLLRTLWEGPHSISITVHDGEVVLAGEVETDTMAEMIEAFARRVPGVVSVDSKLSVREAGTPTARPLTPVQ